MATSGTFTGNRGGGSTGPYLSLAWSRIETDIPNNRSKIRLTLRLHADYRISFSANKTGKLHNSAFTYTSGASGTGSWTLRTQDVWINHNSDGSKSQSFSANFNIAISWGGSHVSSLSVSGTANIDSIPRASGLTAFSLSNSTLQASTVVTVNYTLDRKSSAFSHAMTLRIGSKTIKSWTDSGTDSRTQGLSTSEVNEIIKAIPSTTSGTLTLQMQTKSGSSNIGSSQSRTTSFSLNSNIKPSASGLAVSIAGSGRDKTINKYVQTISKVTASFTGSAGFGSNVSLSSIVVRRDSDKGNSQTINGTSGTTANEVSLSGIYEIIGTVTDRRGRSDTVRTTITVEAYQPPIISTFRTTRDLSTDTKVNALIQSSWSPIGTFNPADITITGVDNGGVSATHYTSNANTSGILNVNQAYTNQSSTSSFVYTIKITDSFGNEATAESTIGTAFREWTIRHGEGVGIGKIHEQGVLDVDGDAYFKGRIIADRTVYYYSPYVGEISSFDDITTEWSLVSGQFHNAPSGIRDDLGNAGMFVYVNTVHYEQGYSKQMAYGYVSNQTWTRFQYNGVWSGWLEDGEFHGTNTNGNWVKFGGGTMICTIYPGSIPTPNANGSVARSADNTWNFPAEFIEKPVVYYGANHGNRWGNARAVNTIRANFWQWAGTPSGSAVDGFLIAIGRWK